VKAAFLGFGWFAELLITRVFADVPELHVISVVEKSKSGGSGPRSSACLRSSRWTISPPRAMPSSF
jgi:hypothetical protein